MWCIYTKEYYPAIKMNKVMPYAATWMQLEIIILNEVKSEKERHISYDITYIWNVNYGTNEPIYKTEIDSQTYIDIEIRFVVAKGKGGKERDGLGLWSW